LIRDYGGWVLARCVGQLMAVPRGGWCNFTGLKICSGAGFSGRRFGGAFCSFGLAFIGRSLGKNCCRFVDGRHHYVAVTISPVYGVVCVQ
jgi:hypothetical protein